MRINAHAWLLALSLGLLSPTVEAGNDQELLGALTCWLDRDIKSLARISRYMESKAEKTADGDWYLSERIRGDEACVEHATVAAAFGVYMTVAAVCDGDVESFKRFLVRGKGLAQEVAPPDHPAALAAFQAPNYSLVLFRGEPVPGREPDPASSTVSYICTYRGGGPQ